MNAGPRTRVKICGLTRLDDVREACALGVDAVGFVCFPGSRRFVAPERLAGLASAVAPFVTPVLLFVDAPATAVRGAIASVPQALLQFHGSEDAAYCASFGRPYVRAVAIDATVDLLEWERRFSSAVALLADAPAHAGPASGPGPVSAADPVESAQYGTNAQFGGSGRTFPWERLPQPQQRRLPLILAGGLQADNVLRAIDQVRPYAVDVSSGVESAPGVKSAERMRTFLAHVHRADAHWNSMQGGAA
jgi:phosphoribosylanthranilate isomerase